MGQLLIPDSLRGRCAATYLGGVSVVRFKCPGPVSISIVRATPEEKSDARYLHSSTGSTQRSRTVCMIYAQNECASCGVYPSETCYVDEANHDFALVASNVYDKGYYIPIIAVNSESFEPPHTARHR
jgi:hypothetical protein